MKCPTTWIPVVLLLPGLALAGPQQGEPEQGDKPSGPPGISRPGPAGGAGGPSRIGDPGKMKTISSGETDESATQSTTVAETIAGHKRLKTLAAAIEAAGLKETLGSDGKEFTVFAPNDGAFKKLPSGTVDSLLKPESKDKLTKILTYHVVDGSKSAEDVAAADGGLQTLQGGKLIFKDGMIGTEENMVKVITKDIECSNGVVHIITGVLMPGE